MLLSNKKKLPVNQSYVETLHIDEYFLSVKKDKAAPATAPQGEDISSEMKLRAEEKSLVMAIRDTFLPRMQGRDASIFCTLITDIWPHVDLPLLFGGESPLSKPPQSRISSRARTAKSDNSARSLKGEKCVYFFFSTRKHFPLVEFVFFFYEVKVLERSLQRRQMDWFMQDDSLPLMCCIGYTCNWQTKIQHLFSKHIHMPCFSII